MNRLGAIYDNTHCRFTVWAPERQTMILHIVHPTDEEIIMNKDDFGYFSIDMDNIQPGTRYFFRPDGLQDFPDPAAFSQPEGVHGPSEIVDHALFQWNDREWRGLFLNEAIFYEIHTGTFTPEGTFSAIIPYLDDIKESGINTLELMPIAQFPGNRNWGYDGCYPYAVQDSYGGPEGLKLLVDACHNRGIMVFLDVVYNHLGPEGNYFNKFGPYFTSKYQVPWGNAINFDGDWSDGVREFFAGNALYWFEKYHLDGLRVDAIHTIYDIGAVSFWELLNNHLKNLEQKLGRHFYLVAESDLNSPRVVKPIELGGLGFDAQWLDDFHHALYVLLDPAGKERYEDFGWMDQLAKAYTDGFVHSGEYVRFRKRKYGSTSSGIPGDKFVVFNQNHDQVGNRVKGERLSSLVDFSRLKIAAAAIMLSPYIPLLFMGEEYGEDTPFYYFVSHSDPDLIEAVREGRKKEFENYQWNVEPPDPQSEDTFLASKIDWDKRIRGKYLVMLKWHQELINLRNNAAFRNFNKNDIRILSQNEKGLVFLRKSEDEQQVALCVFNMSNDAMELTIPNYSQAWTKILYSKDAQWLIPEEDRPELLLKTEADNGETVLLPESSVAVYKNK